MYDRYKHVLSSFVHVEQNRSVSVSQLPYVVLQDPPHSQHSTATLQSLTHNLSLKWIIKVKVGSVNTLAVVDTASTLSYVDKELLLSPSIHSVPQADQPAVTAANGGSIAIEGSARATFSVPNTGFKSPQECFNVIPIPYKGIGMILGQDFHTKYKMDILNSTQAITWHHKGHTYGLKSTDLIPPAEVPLHRTSNSMPYLATDLKALQRDLNKGSRLILVMPTPAQPVLNSAPTTSARADGVDKYNAGTV